MNTMINIVTITAISTIAITTILYQKQHHYMLQYVFLFNFVDDDNDDDHHDDGEGDGDGTCTHQ